MFCISVIPPLDWFLMANKAQTCALGTCAIRIYALCTCALGIYAFSLLRSRNLYNCRESSTNRPYYAKQTQFAGHPHERNILCRKGLSRSCRIDTAENKPNSKPNKPNLPEAKMSASSLSTRDYENQRYDCWGPAARASNLRPTSFICRSKANR